MTKNKYFIMSMLGAFIIIVSTLLSEHHGILAFFTTSFGVALVLIPAERADKLERWLNR
jgi:hypothetical protein